MSVFDRIDSVFNNQDFLMSAAVTNKFDSDRLYSILTITLNYFLATRDTSTSFSVEEIESSYKKLNERCLTCDTLENIVTNGFLTHSFNAVERKLVERYGFDYMQKISPEKREELEKIYADLRILEHELGKSKFLTYREKDNGRSIAEQEVFLTFPGSKTIYYAKNAPERFYLGPVGRFSFSDFPMMVGESQKDYLMRILKYRIEYHTYNVDQDELCLLAEKVVEYYIKEGSCISFVGISEIIENPIYTVQYGMGGDDSLKKFCKAMLEGRYMAEHVFTHQKNDRYEAMDVGNLVTLARYIPQDLSFVNFPDVYSLKQQYLNSIGLDKGVPVSYDNCLRIVSMDDYPDDIKKYYS